jgi:hypothetical protein
MPVALTQLRVEASLDASDYINEAERKAAADKKMIDSGGQVAASIDQTERRLTQSSTTFDRLARSIDPVTKAQTDFTRNSATLQRALDSGTVSVARYNELLQILQRRYADQTKATGEHGASLEYLGVRYRSLGSGVREFISQLQEGVDPMTALSASGVRLAEAFKSIEYFISPAGIAIAGLSTLLYLAISRAQETEQSVRTLNLQLQAVGGTGQVTGQQLHELVEHLHDTGTGLAEANTMVQVLARSMPTLRFDPTLAANIAEISRGLSTLYGGDAASWEQKFVTALANGTAGVKSLAHETHTLTPAVAEATAGLGANAGALGALQLVLQELQQRGLMTAFADNMSEWQKQIIVLSAAWSHFLDTLGQSDIITSIRNTITAGLTSAAKAVEDFKWPTMTLPTGQVVTDWESIGASAGKAFASGFTTQEGDTARAIRTAFEGFGKGAGEAFYAAIREQIKSQFTIENLKNLLPFAPGYQPQTQAPPGFEEGGTTVPNNWYDRFQQWRNPTAPSASAALPPVSTYTFPSYDLAPTPQGGSALPGNLGLPTASFWDGIGSFFKNFNPIGSAQGAEMGPKSSAASPGIVESNTDALKANTAEGAAADTVVGENTRALNANTEKISWVPTGIGDAIATQGTRALQYMMDKLLTGTTIVGAAGQMQQAPPERFQPGSPETTAQGQATWNKWFGWTGVQDNPVIFPGILGTGGQTPARTPTATVDPNQPLISGLKDAQVSVDKLSEALAKLDETIAGMPQVLGTAIATAVGNMLSSLEPRGRMGGMQLASYSAGGGDQVIPSGSGLIASLIQLESGNQNITQRISDINSARGTPAQGYLQITDPTWRQYAPPQIYAQYASAIQASRDVQIAVGSNIPLSRFGTKDALQARYGPLDTSKTIGQLDAENKSTETYINLTKEADRAEKDRAANFDLVGVGLRANQAFQQSYNQALAAGAKDYEAWGLANRAYDAVFTEAVVTRDRLAKADQARLQGQAAAQQAYQTENGYIEANVAAIEALARAQAQAEVTQRGRTENARGLTNAIQDQNSVNERAAQITIDQSAAAATAAAKTVPDLKQQIELQNQLADAYAESTKTGIETQANQASSIRFQAARADALAAVNLAQATDNQQIKENAARQLENVDATIKATNAQTAANTAARENLQLGREIGQTKTDITLDQRRVALVGETTVETQRQLTIYQAILHTQTDMAGASEQMKQLYIDERTALADVNVQLQLQLQQQARINEMYRGMADTIDQTIGTALNDVFSGTKINDWGQRMQSMLSQIGQQWLQTTLIKPAIGSAFGGTVGEQFGTLGQSLGGLSKLGDLFGGGGGSTGGGGFLSGLGSLFGGGGAAAAAGPSAFMIPGTETALAGEAVGAVAGGGGILGGLGGMLGGIAPFLGPLSLLTSLFKIGGPPPSNASGGNINLTSPGGTVNIQTSGSNVNAGAATGMLNEINTFAAALKQQTGGYVGGTLSGQAFTNKQGQQVYQLDYGAVKAQFSSAADAVKAAEVAMLNNIQGVDDNFKAAASHITDPSQLQDMLTFLNTYEKVQTAFDGILVSFDDVGKQAGPFSQALDKMNSQYQQLIVDTAKWGIDFKPVNDAWFQALQRLQGDFNENITKMTRAANDSFAGTLEAEKQAGLQRVTDALKVGGDIAAVDRYNAANLEKVALDASAQLGQMSNDFGDTIGALSDTLNNTFKQIEQQATTAFQSTGGVTQSTGTDPISQAFNAIQTQYAAAAQAAATSFPTSTAGFQTQIDAANKAVSDLTQQADDFTKATTYVNEALQGVIGTAQKYASDLQRAVDLAATFGQVVQDSLAGVEQAALNRLKVDFDANISGLFTALTDPVQAAVTTEYLAGQNRIAIAKQVGGDLDQVNRYNDANLKRVAQQAATATTDITVAIEAAVGKIGTLATTGNLGQTGTFGQAISSAVGTSGQTAGVFTQAMAALNDAFGVAIANVTALSQDTPDFTALLRGYASSIDQLRSAFSDQITTALEALTDPVQAALNAELKAGQQRVADAQAIGADMAQVDAFNAANLQKVGAAALAAADNVADLSTQLQTLNDAIKQLTSGTVSGLTPAQNVTAQQNQFQQLLAAVQSGDLTQLGALGTAGTGAVQASQAAYGNAPQTAQLRAQVLAGLQGVQAMPGVQGITAANAVQENTPALVAAFKKQVDAAETLAAQLENASLQYQQQHGVVSSQLQSQSSAARAVADNMRSQYYAQNNITQTTVDQGKVTVANFQQQADAAGRTTAAAQGTSDTTMSSFQLAQQMLAFQQNLATQNQQSQSSSLAAQVAIAQQVIAAQQAAADAFTAAVNAYKATVAAAAAAAVLPPAPNVTNWGSYHIAAQTGWSGTFFLTPAEAANWSAQQYVVAYQYAIPEHPGYNRYDVYLTHPIETDVMGSSDLAAYWRSQGLSVRPNQLGGKMPMPGWTLVGEAGPELMHVPGGTQVLAHGITPPAAANDDAVVELRLLRSAVEALLKQTQGGHVQAVGDAKMIAATVDQVKRELQLGGPMQRRVV